MNNSFSKYKIYAQLASASYNDGMRIPDGYKIMTTEFSSLVTGFQASLYINTNNEKILAIRGTDVAFNRPLNTIEDLYNDFQLALAGVNLQELDLEKYYNKLISQGIISPNEKIIVVGHSLGGYLAQILTLKHPEVVDHTYTFNAPGIGGLPGTLLNALGIENIYNPKITDIVAKDSLSLIAGTGLNAGQEVEVSGESHSSVDLTKILYFYDEMIKNGASEEMVTNYLSGLHKSSKAIFKGGVANIAEQTMQKIDKIINKAINKTDIIDICQAYENGTNNINFNIQLINPDSTIPNSNSSIENLYALINLNPFIVSGVSSKAYTELEKHKDEYSDSYITNKTKMLKLALDNKEPINGIYFKDYETNTDIDTTDDFNGMYDEYHFGTNSNDTINPIGTKISLDKNYIYTLAGNDNIIAPKGDNYIEAGSGSDTIDLRNSKGNNTIYADNKNSSDGKDDGDDTIYGGEGVDTIYGGKGNDTYYVGDKDIIFDSDAKGSVVFEGVTLKGGVYDKDKGVYIDDTDNSITYRLNGDDKATLIVQKEGKSLTINNYTKSSKDLGINLVSSAVSVLVSDSSAVEANQKMNFNISLDRKLEEKEYLVLRVNDKKFLFGTLPNDSNINQGSFDSISSDGKNVTYTYEWNDDTIPQGDRDLVVTPIVESISNDLKVKSIKSAKGTIKDDDRKQNEPDPEYYDPIVIDLNKDGTTTSKLNGAVNFDIDSNGFKEATGWISPEDAFLAYDRDDNGIIDNGNELFGDKTIADTTRGYTDKTAKNGFEALRAFDTNNDNIIDKNDEKFNKLLLWQDKNSNALTDDGELFALQDKNIKSIDLNYQEVSIDNNGNFIKQTSTVTFNDNTTTTADDVWFKVDLKDTEQSDADISSSITALPEIYAFGNIYNLRNAMSMDSSLVDMVNGYVVLDQDSKEKQIDNLIFKWAGVEGIDINSRGSYIDARVLGVYEKMTGKPFYHKSFGSNPNSSVANMLNDLYKEFKDYAYATIELQTTYKGLIDTKYQYYNYDANKYGYDFSNLNSKIRELYNSQNHEEIAKINGLVKKAAIYRDNLLASFEENLINLTAGNEHFKYVAMSNYIKGTDSGETINGSNANDWIEGKKGDDYLSGGSGDDIYVYTKGDGNDTIYDPQGANKLKFRDINRDEVDFLRENDYLSIQIKDTNEKIMVQNFFNHYTQPAISIFEFADGATVLANEIRAFNLIGDDNDNSIYGFISDDVLKGNQGNDKLYGGQGNDAYVFNRGDGKDTIDDESGQDTIKFEGDITPEDILLTREQDRLIINILDKDKRPTGDSIIVTDFFSFSSELGDGNIEKIVFSNGQIWDKNKILEKAKLEATENRDTFYLTSNDDVFDALGGDDEIRGGVGNDTIAGNQGNDTLYGDDGNDTLIGGKGNDKLYGGSGNDTYVYYKGDGNDVIEDTSGNNIIDFKNIKFDEIEFLKNNINLVIKIKESGETITISNILSQYMNSDNFTFKFMDERVVSIQDVELSLIGDDQNNYLTGYQTSDTIYGKKGNDAIYGGSGNDTYIYYKGDGNDTISDHSGSDTLDFKDITKNEVRFLKKDDNLLIDIKDTNEKIKIESFFYDSNSLKTFKFSDGTSMTSDEIKAVFLIGDEHDNAIYGYASNDKLFGKEGNDKLYGRSGNDIIDGGVGNDILIGNEGSDTYLFGRGDGKDVIYALDISSYRFNITQNGDYVINNYYNINFSQGKDIIKFKEGITKNDLTFERAGTNQYDLLIKIKDSEDSITVKDMFKDVSDRIYSIDKIEFSDGSSMGFEEIFKSAIITIDPSNESSFIGSLYDDVIHANYKDNKIEGGSGNDIIYGKLGNDTLEGENGNDKLYGDEGNDKLYGGAGHDIIEGGKGNDTLYGDGESDTYIFGKGDGQDTIHADGKDTLKFKEGVTKDNLVFQRVKSNQYEYNPADLLIRVKNSEDSITVKEMFKESDNSKGLEKIEFSDGLSMGLEDIKKATLLIDDSENYTIYGFEADDTIKGGSGNDIIYGKNGNDTIETGAGNDTLYGGEGNDIYIFGRGDGEDIIYDEANSYDEEVILNRNDVIKFKEGISINDLEFKRVGESKENLLIKIKDSEDSITVKNMFKYENNRSGINKILFNDGSSMDYKDIVKASPVAPNLSNDSIYGSKYSDTIYGDDRNNTIYGKDGDDLIYGKAGNDDLSGENGDDILEGGVGNDTLRGEEGSDTYIFSRGDGEDTIYSDGKDTIKFKDGVSEDDLIIARAESNTNSLLIRIKDSTDSILVKDMFINENNTKGIKGIEFNDGSLIDYEDIRKKVLISSDPDQTRFEGFSSNDIIVGSNKDDYIYGKDGDDRLVGNKGNDTIYAGDGNDTIDAGEGDDKIDGGKGSDTYLFGRGDGQDEIENYDDSLNRMDDTIKFKEGITRDDLIFQRVRKHDDSSDFVVKIKGTEDSILVRHMFDVINNNHILNEKFKISKIEFSDGSSMNIEDINQALKNNNVMILDNPYWRSHEGSDENDEIYGDDDRNTLNGNKGDDILIGGKDYDELCGGEGNDTYLFGRGDGNDTIYNDDSTLNRRDIIKFKEGITADDLVFKRTNGSGRDLKIEIKGADDSITVNDMFDSENTTKHIDGVELSDGSFISLEDIKLKTLTAMDSNDATLYGFETDDIITGKEGNDTLYGGGGSDILRGLQGNDTYFVSDNSLHVTIEDISGDDFLIFKDWSLQNKLKFEKDDNDLLITNKFNIDQSVRIKNHFLEKDYAIDRIKFEHSDYVIAKEEINKLINIIHLSSENSNGILNGGKEDHIYTYTGGKVSISDLGGDDKVVFRLDNPGDGLFYLSNGRDLKISTNRIDDSNNDVLEIKNFFINKNAVIENFDINDHWSVTAESIFEKFGKPFPPELPDTPTPPPPSNPDNGSSGNTLTGGSEDNIFNYNGGIVSITDTGGNDKVIFSNPGSKVYYSSNGRDLKISTAEINSSNSNILEVKNFFVNKSSIVEKFQLNDYWTVTAQSIYQAFGLTYPADNTNPTLPNPNPPSDSNNLTGGTEDNVFTYTGGKKSITDTGGNDKVIFANPGSKVYYSSNGRDLKISTAKINSSNNDVLEIKNFFIDANAIIETFQINNYWTVTAQSIYKKFGKTYPTTNETPNSEPLGLLGTPNQTDDTGLNTNTSEL